jgi:nitrite reductase/ring-hydroxylating ferredoxin subunit
MVRKSKIILFLVTALFALTLITCKKSKYDVIPDVFVDFTISLDDAEFFALRATTGYAFIDARTNNLGTSAAGFDGNGIIIYNNDDQFYAFDRTCPYDFYVNSKSIKLNVDFIYAVCPECGTKYALAVSGLPASGPGKYQLKPYKTAFTPPYVHVWHY